MNGFVQEASGQAKTQRERAVDCPGEESSLVKSPHSIAHMERIQHYQEELRKRREEDGRGKHDIDPNASLRLKKLSENPKLGIDNPTFDGKENAIKDTCYHDPVDGEWSCGGAGVVKSLWGQRGVRRRGGHKGEEECRYQGRMGNCEVQQKFSEKKRS